MLVPRRLLPQLCGGAALPLWLALVSICLAVAPAAVLADAPPYQTVNSAPIRNSWYGRKSTSCVGSPVRSYAPYDSLCFDSEIENFSMFANCSADGLWVTVRTFHGIGCDQSTLWEVAYGSATSDSCISVYDTASPPNFLGSMQAVCPVPGLVSTVTVQDIRPTVFVPKTELLVPFALSSVDPVVNGSYAVIWKDINQDGRPDLVSLASGEGSVVWYENLGVPKDAPLTAVRWRPHLIARLLRPIYASFADVDGDNVLDIVVATDFNVPPKNASLKEGAIYWFRQRGPDNWQQFYIGQVQGAHRSQWQEHSGEGKGTAMGMEGASC